MATGSMQKRSKGSWTLRFDLGPDAASGKRRQKTVSVKGPKREAERVMREMLTSLENGSYIRPEKLTVGQYLRDWLKNYVWPNLSPSTAKGYESIVQYHLIPNIGAITLQALEPGHINSFQTQLMDGQRSNRTVLNIHRCLSKSLNQAVRLQLIMRNPAQAIDAPRPKHREMVTLTDEQMNRFLEAIKGDTFEDAFILAIYTGLRRGELLGLRWSDVNLDFAQLAVRQTLLRITGHGLIIKSPKTPRSRRTIALPPAACITLRTRKERRSAELAALKCEISETDLIFGRLNGAPFDPGAFSHAFKRIIRRLGLPDVAPHSMRHYHATKLLRQGVSPKVVSNRLGHSSIGVTMDVYAHVLPDQDTEAALIFEQGLNLRDHNVSKPHFASSQTDKFEAKPL